MIHSWQIDPIFGMLVTAALSVVLVLFISLVGLPQDRLTPRRRRILSVLRLAAATLTILALWRPTLVRTETRPQSSTLVVLADQSRSMTVADALAGKTRWDVLRQTLADAEPALKKLRGEHLEVRVYTFDADLHPIELGDEPLELPDKPRGAANRHRRGPRRSAAERGGQTAVGRGAADRRCPAGLRSARHRTANPGPAIGRSRLSAVRLCVWPGAGKDKPATWRSRIWSSIKPSSSRINWRFWPTPASMDWSIRTCRCNCCSRLPAARCGSSARAICTASQDGVSLPVEFDYAPETPGEYKLTVRAEPQPGEIVTTNNSLSTFVTVLRGGLNVLVSGRGAARRVDVSLPLAGRLGRHQGGIRPSGRARSAASRTLDLKPLLARGKYDVYILGDVDSSAFRPDELATLAAKRPPGGGAADAWRIPLVRPRRLLRHAAGRSAADRNERPGAATAMASRSAPICTSPGH